MLTGAGRPLARRATACAARGYPTPSRGSTGSTPNIWQPASPLPRRTSQRRCAGAWCGGWPCRSPTTTSRRWRSIWRRSA